MAFPDFAGLDPDVTTWPTYVRDSINASWAPNPYTFAHAGGMGALHDNSDATYVACASIVTKQSAYLWLPPIPDLTHVSDGTIVAYARWKIDEESGAAVEPYTILMPADGSLDGGGDPTLPSSWFDDKGSSGPAAYLNPHAGLSDGVIADSTCDMVAGDPDWPAEIIGNPDGFWVGFNAMTFLDTLTIYELAITIIPPDPGDPDPPAAAAVRSARMYPIHN